MIKGLTMMSMIFASIYAQAAQYECDFSTSLKENLPIASFTLDTSTEENKFVNANGETTIGCVVLRTSPEIMTCTVACPGKFSGFATVDVGTSILGLQTSYENSRYELICVKK